MNNNGAISCPLNAEMPPPPSPSMSESNANTNANSQPALTGSLSEKTLLIIYFKIISNLKKFFNFEN